MGQRKAFHLDAICLNYLDGFDGRKGSQTTGKSERVRAGVTLDCLLTERYSPEFVSELAGLVRQGDRTDALRALNTRITNDLDDTKKPREAGGNGAPVGGDSSPRADGTGGDDTDDVGGSLPSVPRVEGNEKLEGAQEKPESAPAGDSAGEGGEDSGTSGKRSDRGGLGTGVISKALGLDK